VDNHTVVHTTFPIDDALPLTIEEIRAIISEDFGYLKNDNTVEEKPPNKAWGDQLSWWQRVGRWK
jgi:hypothetical protein